MERTKVAIGAVIAVCLVKLAFGDVLVRDARAAEGAVTCDAIYADKVVNIRRENSMEAAMVHANAVKAWLEAHPGDPVFRTTLVNGQGAYVYGYIDIVCVRS